MKAHAYTANGERSEPGIFLMVNKIFKCAVVLVGLSIIVAQVTWREIKFRLTVVRKHAQIARSARESIEVCVHHLL